MCWVVTLCLAACDSSAQINGGVTADSAGSTGAGRAIDVSAASVEVWTADPSVRVQPTTVAEPARRVIIAGPRAAYESYQVIVRAGSERLDDVNITASDLSDGRGHSIRASNITLFRQWFIDFAGVDAENGTRPVPQHSPTRDARVPDPLIPLVDPYTGKALGAPFRVDAGMNRPIWVDVFIPPDASPGGYRGTLSVSSTNHQPIEVPIELTVWDIVLPDQRAVPTLFQMDIDPLINFHRDTWKCDGGSCYLDWTAQTRLVIKRYEELAHSHRIDVGQAGTRGPASANECAAPSDWSEYDDSIRPYIDGSYYADRVPSTRLQVPLTPGADYGPQTCSQAQYKAIAKAWADHLKQNGWFERAVIFAEDEPPPEIWPRLAQHARWIVEADREWKPRIIATMPATPAQAPLFDPVIGVYVTCLKCYDNWYLKDDAPFGRQQWRERFKTGTRLWFYESNAQVAPYPTFASNTLDGNEPRIMMWGSWFEGATGFLYWQINQWTIKHSWGPNIEYGVTGDGVLIYPGHHDGLVKQGGSPEEVTVDGPIASIRLKQIRNALQDWALFAMAEDKGHGDYARSQIAQIYSQLGACTWRGCGPMNGTFYWRNDEARMQEIRRNIASAITRSGPAARPKN